jgi:DNA-binding HxlR family transcriptional regulator
MTARQSTPTPPRRSPCPVACTLDLIGDRWTLLIIRDLFAGKSRYKDLANSPEKIATNILADRLKSLQSRGLVRARPAPDRANATAYSLTPKGRALLPLLAALRDWGLANIRGTRALVAAAPSPSA